MPEFLNRIFGNDVQKVIVDYYNTMKAKGDKFVQEMNFSGKMQNPSQAVFGFSKSVVTMSLKVKYAVEEGHAYITDAIVKTDVPWAKKYFFFCKKEGGRFELPSFPSVADLKAKWCQSKKDSKEKHPEGKEWCQTDIQTSDDYYLYGNPYPASLQDCAVVKSLEIYSFHLEPDSDGIDAEADIKYDMRIQLWGYRHVTNDGKLSTGYGISKYFAGGLMLGGAYDDFKKFLAKTKASMDCTPALEGLLQTMLAPPKFATR